MSQVEGAHDEESVDIANKIETLENQFDNLRTRTKCELSKKHDITVKTLIDTLTSLPLSLRSEYDSIIRRNIQVMRKEKQVDELFFHLNPLLSFMDYGLIELFIKKFGSHGLKKDMRSYCSEMKVFMKETTIKQLLNHLPGQLEIPPKFSLLEAKIGQDASKCTLEQIDTIRRRYCIELQLSKVVLHLVAVAESNSFIIRWLVPADLILRIVKSTRDMKLDLFEECKITSLTLDGMWLYMNEAEIKTMWLNVTDTRINDLFHAIYKRIVYELKIEEISVAQLSQFLMDQQPNLPIEASIALSEAFISHSFSPCVMDFEMLDIIIEQFGSDFSKNVMQSYCSYMSVFAKHSTAKWLINLMKESDYNIPPKFLLIEARIGQDASMCTLEHIDAIRRRYCNEFQLPKIVLHLVAVTKSNPFIIKWLVPLDLISIIMKFTRALKVNFFEECKITSFTLDRMCLYMSEAEIEAMWLNVSDNQINDQFVAIQKQMVNELKVEEISLKELSQCLMDQQPNLPEDASIQLSEALLNHHSFHPSFVDFEMLDIIVEQYGSHYLESMMKSYCSYMSVFTKHLTAERLINLQAVHSEHPPNILKTECRIMKQPSDYSLEDVESLKDTLCTELDFNTFTFAMILNNIRSPISGSFSVSWLVPTCFTSDLIESVSHINSAFYVRNNIASLSIGNQWVYNPKLFHFSIELKKKYQQSQGSPSPVEWIPSPTRKIFRLAMIQRERVQRGHIEDRFVRMTISGRVDDILHTKSPVELEYIFRHEIHESEIILIEGAPGSGKSTLTVHICQRWGKEELFQQFTVVILVQLRDPAVQRVQTIADLLPVEHVAVAQELADDIVSTNGRSVLWVLDGWDELPTHLQQDSIFHKIIQRISNMCSVIVTSRPISSGDLHPEVSSRIEVLGFTPVEQRQYFSECFKGDTKALKALLEKIQENPVVQSICYLPLNAAFVAHTFKYKDQILPNTEYEIYLNVILSCIQRHFEREGKNHDLPRELASLNDLSRSEVMRKPFQRLCELAYYGVMENKVTFSSSDLPQGSNTLSLLQAIESFLQFGKSVFYNFLHLSIQEVLSAYYIATYLSDSEQVSRFQQLFNQPRFAAVFQFYTAITKLKSPGIRQVITRIVEAKSKPLSIALLHCLYEAQDPSLCLYVAERLEYKLDISKTSLSPLDCFSVSFFLSSVTNKQIFVDLEQCSIGDLGAKRLTKYLCSDVDNVGKLTINLCKNDIYEKGASHVAGMLRFNEHIYLSDNPIGDTAVFLISVAVAELKTLMLRHCGITSRGAEYLSRVLPQNSSLEKLDITRNNLGDEGIGHMAKALKQNTQLKELWIGECGMTDKGAASLASALSVNNSLKMLHIGSWSKGALTEDGISTITQSLANNPEFVKLAIPYQFDPSFGHLKWKVNEARKRNGLQPIEIEGECCILVVWVCHANSGCTMADLS